MVCLKSLWLKILLVRNTYACFSMMGLDAGIRVLRFHPSRLDDYWGGRIDLRTLYLNPENDNEYFNVSYNDNHYELQSFEGKALPEERLPEKGYFHVESRSEIYTIKVPSCDKNIFQDIARRMGWVCM